MCVRLDHLVGACARRVGTADGSARRVLQYANGVNISPQPPPLPTAPAAATPPTAQAAAVPAPLAVAAACATGLLSQLWLPLVRACEQAVSACAPPYPSPSG